MTEISKAAKAKASALWEQGAQDRLTPRETLAQFIQQASDAAKEAVEMIRNVYGDAVADDLYCLAPFILPEPEPADPLDELFAVDLGYGYTSPQATKVFREGLAKRGLKIVEDCHDGR